MLLRSLRFVARLMLLILLSTWLPQAPISAPQPITVNIPEGGALDAPPASASPQPLPPSIDPQLPSLSLSLAVTPDPIAIGETAVVTVTVTNAAPHPASNLEITLPTPDGALALSGEGMVGPRISSVFTGLVQLVRRPTGDALLLRAQATADAVSIPVQATGGALVVSRGVGAASFLPGIGNALRSLDGRVSVQIPSRAFARRLALRHRNLDEALADLRASNQPIPPALANGRRSFGPFVLDATDDAGADIHEFSQPLTISVRYTPEQLQVLGIPEGNLRLFWFDADAGRWVALPSQLDTSAGTVSAAVDHFSVYTIGDGLSPSTAFIPTLQGFQVSNFTGAASYNASCPVGVRRLFGRPAHSTDQGW